MPKVERRDLPYTYGVTFSHHDANTPKLLRKIAKYLEGTGETFLSAQYTNEFDKDGYYETITIFVEET